MLHRQFKQWHIPRSPSVAAASRCPCWHLAVRHLRVRHCSTIRQNFLVQKDEHLSSGNGTRWLRVHSRYYTTESSRCEDGSLINIKEQGGNGFDAIEARKRKRRLERAAKKSEVAEFWREAQNASRNAMSTSLAGGKTHDLAPPDLHVSRSGQPQTTSATEVSISPSLGDNSSTAELSQSPASGSHGHTAERSRSAEAVAARRRLSGKRPSKYPVSTLVFDSYDKTAFLRELRDHWPPIDKLWQKSCKEQYVLLLCTANMINNLDIYKPDGQSLLTQIIENLFYRKSSYFENGMQLKVAVAVVDRLSLPIDASSDDRSEKPAKATNPYGLAYALVDGLDWVKNAPERIEKEDVRLLTLETKTLDCQSDLEGRTAIASGYHMQIPLANTIFRTGQENVLRMFTFVPTKIDSPSATNIIISLETKNDDVPTSNKSDANLSQYYWQCREAHDVDRVTATFNLQCSFETLKFDLFTPLKPLTQPTIVEASMGNIVRQVRSKDGHVMPASTELETAVNSMIRQHGAPSSPVAVWALISAEQQSSAKEGSSVNIAKNMPDLSRQIQRGARLHRVVSGGGGWGKKVGLLSLSPGVSFDAPLPDDDLPAPSWVVPEHESEDMHMALNSPIKKGDTIQFFLADSITSIPSNGSPISLTLDVGAIYSTVDAMPSIQSADYKGEDLQIRSIPMHFGALSEKGFAVSGGLSTHGQPSARAQTVVDVPLSRLVVRDATYREKYDPGKTRDVTYRALSIAKDDRVDAAAGEPDEASKLATALASAGITPNIESPITSDFSTTTVTRTEASDKQQLAHVKTAIQDARTGRQEAYKALRTLIMPDWVRESFNVDQQSFGSKLHRLKKMKFMELAEHYLALSKSDDIRSKGLSPEYAAFWRAHGFPMDVVLAFKEYFSDVARKVQLPREFLKQGFRYKHIFRDLRDLMYSFRPNERAALLYRFKAYRKIQYRLDHAVKQAFQDEVREGMQIGEHVHQLLAARDDPEQTQFRLAMTYLFRRSMLTPWEGKESLYAQYGFTLQLRRDLWRNDEFGTAELMTVLMMNVANQVYAPEDAVAAVILEYVAWSRSYKQEVTQQISTIANARPRHIVTHTRAEQGGLFNASERHLHKVQRAIQSPWETFFRLYSTADTGMTSQKWRDDTNLGLFTSDVSKWVKFRPDIIRYLRSTIAGAGNTDSVTLNLGANVRESYASLFRPLAEQLGSAEQMRQQHIVHHAESNRAQIETKMLETTSRTNSPRSPSIRNPHKDRSTKIHFPGKVNAREAAKDLEISTGNSTLKGTVSEPLQIKRILVGQPSLNNPAPEQTKTFSNIHNSSTKDRENDTNSRAFAAPNLASVGPRISRHLYSDLRGRAVERGDQDFVSEWWTNPYKLAFGMMERAVNAEVKKKAEARIKEKAPLPHHKSAVADQGGRIDESAVSVPEDDMSEFEDIREELDVDYDLLERRIEAQLARRGIIQPTSRSLDLPPSPSNAKVGTSIHESAGTWTSSGAADVRIIRRPVSRRSQGAADALREQQREQRLQQARENWMKYHGPSDPAPAVPWSPNVEETTEGTVQFQPAGTEEPLIEDETWSTQQKIADNPPTKHKLMSKRRNWAADSWEGIPGEYESERSRSNIVREMTSRFEGSNSKEHLRKSILSLLGKL